jgi:hypothetical protein
LRPTGSFQALSADDETAGAPVREATVWAVGDSADGSAAAGRVARLIARDKPARLLYLGDVYERGTESEFSRNYDPLYGPLRRITAPTPGNHDQPNVEQGYDRYWSRTAGGSPPHFYFFRFAGWRVISLTSEDSLQAGSKQRRWLDRQMRRGRGNCRLAFWHRPRYSAGTRHGDDPTVDPLWRAVRGRAALVVNGHDHNMQELRARDGTTTLIAGAGGHSRYGLDGGDPRLAWANATDDGALRLRLRPGKARFAFVAADGRVLRRGLVRCNP